MKVYFRGFGLLAGTALAALAMPAAAQVAPTEPAAAAPAEDLAADIVVTAQNRAQSVQKVPIAISVFSGEQLKDAGITDLKDIGKIAPSAQITNDNSVIHITVRGIGTYSNDEAQDASVVANIDGEYINRGEALNTALFDLDRVEVLRGPQGTLYGRNSTAGAVNFITRKPGREFGVNADVSYGNYNTVKANAGVDVPFGDFGGLRVAGIYADHDGYFYHPATPFAPASTSGQDRVYGGRVSLLLKPVSGLTINAAVEHAIRDYVNAGYGSVDLNVAGNGPTGPGCNASGFTRVAPNYPQTLCIPNGTNFLASQNRETFPQALFGVGPGFHQNTTAVRGRIAYEFGPEATLSYIGGYRVFDQTGGQGLPTTYQTRTYLNNVKTQSHEVRLNGVVHGVTYQVGGFYFKEAINNESGFFEFFLNPPPLPGFSQNGTFISYFGRKIVSDSKSAFGQIEVPLFDKLTAVGGVRYTNNKRSALYINGSPFVYFGPTGGGAPINDPKDLVGTGLNTNFFGSGFTRRSLYSAGNPTGSSISNLASQEDKITWLAGLNYQADPRTLIYAKVSTGFKGGGFDGVGAYRPETNTAYEGGVKKTFGPSGQHIFNLSGFYYNYRDLQVSVLLNPTLGAQIFNAGKATIYGAEAEASFKLSRYDHFNASFNYLHARYGELLGTYNVFTVPGTGADLNGVGDLDPNTPGIQQPNFAGNTTPFTPTFTITAGFDHVFDLGSTGTIKAAVSTIFKSSYFTDFFNYRDLKQDALTQTDLSLEYRPVNRHFTIQAFARNLENIRPLVYAGYTSAGPDDVINWAFGTPRTYGVRVGVDF